MKSSARLSAAIAFLLLISLQSPAGAASEETLACISLGSNPERARCLEPSFRSAVQSGNTAAALAEMIELFQSGLIDDCHMFAHHLGHVAFEEVADFVPAMRAGGPRCANGYYHGVVESALHNPSAAGHEHHTQLDISRFCSPFRRESKIYDGCVHGLGHGLMHRFGHDVLQSLDMCKQLSGDYERERCQGGVFMENSMQYLELDEELYQQMAPAACSGLPLSRDLLELCYDQIGEVAMFYYEHDLARATELCAAIEESWGRSACTEGAQDELETINLERKGG